MNQNILLIGLLIGALFLLRRPTDAGRAVNWAGVDYSTPGTLGGWGEG